eukprot:8528205-Alexandrium_andersonii.AAC.1
MRNSTDAATTSRAAIRQASTQGSLDADGESGRTPPPARKDRQRHQLDQQNLLTSPGDFKHCAAKLAKGPRAQKGPAHFTTVPRLSETLTWN